MCHHAKFHENQSYAFGDIIIGPIPWGYSGPLCHALSSMLLCTSTCRRRVTVAACDSSDTW